MLTLYIYIESQIYKERTAFIWNKVGLSGHDYIYVVRTDISPRLDKWPKVVPDIVHKCYNLNIGLLMNSNWKCGFYDYASCNHNFCAHLNLRLS